VLEKQLNHRRLGREGYEESHWIALDYGSVVVHLFDETTRDYYRIEELWAGAQKVEWK
jgi:ribosome-associated protein